MAPCPFRMAVAAALSVVVVCKFRRGCINSAVMDTVPVVVVDLKLLVMRCR